MTSTHVMIVAVGVGLVFQFAWLQRQLSKVRQGNRRINMALQELLDNITGWGTSWRERALGFQAVAEAEKARADGAVAQLNSVLENDASEDAEQRAQAVAETRAADEELAQNAWASLQALDTPPSDPPHTDPETGEAPVEPAPVADEPTSADPVLPEDDEK